MTVDLMSDRNRNPFACPACGNTSRATIEDNGEDGLNLTLLCVAASEDGDCNTGEGHVCGCQWEPADVLAEIYPDETKAEDRERIRRWLFGAWSVGCYGWRGNR